MGPTASVTSITAPVAPASVSSTAGDITALTLSEFEIHPTTVKPGQEVRISIVVTNTSDITDNYNVNLRINYKTVVTKNISLDSNHSQKVIFINTQNIPGNYVVSIGPFEGNFTVVNEGKIITAPVNWWLIAVLIIACLIIIWIIIRILVRHRRPV